jgi:ribonuclease HI
MWHEPDPDAETVIVYTNGSAFNNGGENPNAGAGVFYGEGDARNRAIRVPIELNPSNQVGELLGAKEAVEDCRQDVPLEIISDSKYVVDGLTKHLKKWEAEGFRVTSNGELFKATVARLRGRKAKTSLKWIKGHSGVKGNEEADLLADQGANKEVSDIIDMTIPPDLVLPGAKLNTMTQSLAYKIIRQTKMQKESYQDVLERRATMRNMTLAQEAAIDGEGVTPPKRKVWRATRHKDFARSVRFFFFFFFLRNVWYSGACLVHEGSI